ncbi:hypothetical protein GCM10009634_71810 [Saccharothrix xinjiangensis]
MVSHLYRPGTAQIDVEPWFLHALVTGHHYTYPVLKSNVHRVVVAYLHGLAVPQIDGVFPLMRTLRVGRL